MSHLATTGAHVEPTGLAQRSDSIKSGDTLLCTESPPSSPHVPSSPLPSLAELGYDVCAAAGNEAFVPEYDEVEDPEAPDMHATAQHEATLPKKRGRQQTPGLNPRSRTRHKAAARQCTSTGPALNTRSRARRKTTLKKKN